MLIHEGSNNMRIEHCEDNNGSLCCVRAIHGHSGGIPISSILMDYTRIAYDLTEHIYHRGISRNFQSILGTGLIPGGNENDRARQSVFCKALEPFGGDTEEEDRHFDYTVLSKSIL